MSPEEVRDTIVSEARKCFHVYGFRKTTIDDITARMGISKKTVYKHFSSKDDIIKAVVEQIMAPMTLQIDSVIKNRIPLSEALKSILFSIQQISVSMSGPMLNDMKTQPRTLQFLKTMRSNLLERFCVILTKGKKNGTVRENLDINLFIKILINAIDTFANPDTFLEMEMSSDEFAGQVFSIFMNGILNNRGGV
jgi:AcrR family transcriptional regulator